MGAVGLIAGCCTQLCCSPPWEFSFLHLYSTAPWCRQGAEEHCRLGKCWMFPDV